MALEASNDIAILYRDTFSTAKGQVVLFHLLQHLKVYDVTLTDEEVTLRNFGIQLQALIGGGSIDQSTVQEFAKRLMKQPLPKDKE